MVYSLGLGIDDSSMIHYIHMQLSIYASKVTIFALFWFIFCTCFIHVR